MTFFIQTFFKWKRVLCMWGLFYSLSFCFQQIHFIITSFSLIALQNETILNGLSISLFQRNILLNILLLFKLQEEFYNEFTLNCTFKHLKKIRLMFHLLTKRPIWCAFWTTIFHAIGNYDWIKFEYSVYFFSFQFQHINFDAVAVASLTYD